MRTTLTTTRVCHDCGSEYASDESGEAWIRNAKEMTRLGYLDGGYVTIWERCVSCANQYMLGGLRPGLRRYAAELIDAAAELEPDWRVEEWNWKYCVLDIRPWPGDRELQEMARVLESLSYETCGDCGREWWFCRRSTDCIPERLRHQEVPESI